MASYLTEAVMISKVTDQDDIYEHFMTLPNVYERRHPSIFPETMSDLDLVSFSGVDLNGINWIYSGKEFSSFRHSYFKFFSINVEGEKKNAFSVSIIVYGDFTEGTNLIKESISALVSLKCIQPLLTLAL